MPAAQSTVQPREIGFENFPRTRYQGSKRKLATAIVDHLKDLSFTTVLDAFGGTGSVAYALKCIGKHVTYNDILACNHQIGLALIENDTVQLADADAVPSRGLQPARTPRVGLQPARTPRVGDQPARSPADRIDAIGQPSPGVVYDDFIERTFDGIYFTREENHWLDVAVQNIWRMTCQYQRAIAWFALFQAALAKRPYNLFHRANLYMRTADVPRSFGNKATWDRSFADHFRAAAEEANAAVQDSAGKCQATCADALEIEPGYDLVYVDTPYINAKGVGVDYRSFYHFLEGMLHYEDWPAKVDTKSKHRRLIPKPNPWSNPRQCTEMFQQLFEHFADSTLVVSYRSDGIPPIEDLEQMLRKVKPKVQTINGKRYQYALSTRRSTQEVLLIGTN